jgi:hypothetical protein
MTTLTYSTGKSLKQATIIYWIFTSVFVLFEGVGSLFFNTQPAIEGMRHLGFPDYFRVELGIGKIIGGILLIIPAIPARLKEWAYVGFGISCISAFIANLVVGGPAQAWMPVLVFAILVVSYIYYQKIKK